MSTKVGFSKALRTLSDLADALVASGALTEMTGSEFVAYAAGQLALASIEPRDQAAARIAAIKAAIVTAQEQARGLPLHDGEMVVFVKLYDSDEAVLATIESGVAACKSALAALRLPCQEQLSALNQELDTAGRVTASAPAARPPPRRATKPSPRARDFHDDDPDADDWLSENGRRDEDEPIDDEAEPVNVDAEDEDDLDAYMKSLGDVVAEPPPARATRTTGRNLTRATPASTRTRSTAPAKPAAPPRIKRASLPRPVTPDQLARAVRNGHGTGGLTTTRSSMRG